MKSSNAPDMINLNGKDYEKKILSPAQPIKLLGAYWICLAEAGKTGFLYIYRHLFIETSLCCLLKQA